PAAGYVASPKAPDQIAGVGRRAARNPMPRAVALNEIDAVIAWLSSQYTDGGSEIAAVQTTSARLDRRSNQPPAARRTSQGIPQLDPGAPPPQANGTNRR